jgi:hypothetical protein
MEYLERGEVENGALKKAREMYGQVVKDEGIPI